MIDPTVWRRRARLALSLALAALCAAALPARADLPVTQLTAGIHLIQAEVAATEPARERGLMFRRSLAPNAGMLFVFQEKAGHCFWMKNTLLPLSIAWLDDDGKIIDIADMRPMDETSHCPRAPARYALEMAQGWFRQKGITAGMQLGGLRR